MSPQLHDATTNTKPHNTMTTTIKISKTTSTPRHGSRNWVKSLKGDWTWGIQGYNDSSVAVLIKCGASEIAYISLDEDGDIYDNNNESMSANFTNCFISEAAYSDFVEWANANADEIKAAFEADDHKSNSLFA